MMTSSEKILVKKFSYNRIYDCSGNKKSSARKSIL